MLHFSRTLRMTTRVSTLGWSKSFSFAATRVQALVKMCVASLWADSLRTASRIESWAALWTLGDFMTIVMEILARDTASLRGQPVQTHPLVVVVLCVPMRGLPLRAGAGPAGGCGTSGCYGTVGGRMSHPSAFEQAFLLNISCSEELPPSFLHASFPGNSLTMAVLDCGAADLARFRASSMHL